MKITVKDILEKTHVESQVRINIENQRGKKGHISGTVYVLKEALIPHITGMEVLDISSGNQGLVLNTFSRKSIEVLDVTETANEAEDDDE